MYVDRVKKILETHIYHDKCALDGIVLLADDIVQEIMQQGEDIVFDMKERIGNLYEHTIMVTFLSLKVGQDLKLEKDVLKKMALGCLLHDLGIRYITVSYLNCDIEEKTPAEIFEFKKHTILAYSALEGEDWIDSVAKKMILSHHERKDGSGFPLKQKTKEIECNILQACDTFDCFISGMECKRVSVQQALEYLIEASDLLFERKIIKVIQRIIAYYPVGTEVKLSTGENGVVLRQTKNAICPVVAVLDKENRITKVRYDLLKDKKIFILQVI